MPHFNCSEKSAPLIDFREGMKACMGTRIANPGGGNYVQI